MGWAESRAGLGELTCLELPGKQGASLAARQTLGDRLRGLSEHQAVLGFAGGFL